METVLITGASSGIGKDLAAKFAQGGNNLVLVARSEDTLNALAKQLESTTPAKVAVQVADLSRPGAAKKLSEALVKQGVEIDILVNCAGVLEHGRFVSIPATDHQNLIDLNISGLTGMLSYFLPGMVERGKGRVMNVASIAAFQSIPSLATYAATKAYVLSLSESLSEELLGTGVTVTALCPGVTETNMMTKAQEKSGAIKLPVIVVGDSETVAEQGYRACLKGDVICVPGVLNRSATIASRATPKWLMRRLSGVMGRYSVKDH